MNSRTIHQLTNDRIYSRNITSDAMNNPISFRPVITKYTKDLQPIFKTPDDNIITFSTNRVVIKSDPKSSWIGTNKSVDVESVLRDQTTYLGKDKKYVPNIFGDMYNDAVYSPATSDIVAYPYLFKQPEFSPFNPGHNIKANLAFYNSSRLGR